MAPETGDGGPVNAIVRVNGKPFRCPCGCNVFTKRGQSYTCNACDDKYIGEPACPPETPKPAPEAKEGE